MTTPSYILLVLCCSVVAQQLVVQILPVGPQRNWLSGAVGVLALVMLFHRLALASGATAILSP